jgi:dTMP kinase
MFGSPEYFRLWLAQVVSSTGDWIGLVAILSLAARITGSAGGVSLVMAARMVPGFVLAPLGGVLIDRVDRKKLMIGCDVGRAAILACLPFLKTLTGLIVASFLLEILSLLWAPAKDASVPNLVPRSKLAAVNSLNLAAAFGTFPVGAALFASCAKLAEWLGHYQPFARLGADQEFLALWLDSITFVVSALLIMSVLIPSRSRLRKERIDWTRAFKDLKEGMSFIASHRLVRAVMLGLGTGLIGGGAVIPLGKTFSRDVLDAGPAGYGLLLSGLGTGAALGVIALSALKRKPSNELVFAGAIVGTGCGLIALASSGALWPAIVLVATFGVCAGASYVAGFTVIQEHVSDELRGRTFAALYTMIRFCLMLSLTVSPAVSSLLNQLSDAAVGKSVSAFGHSLALPGVRLTLWAGGALVVVAGLVARREVRIAEESMVVETRAVRRAAAASRAAATTAAAAVALQQAATTHANGEAPAATAANGDAAPSVPSVPSVSSVPSANGEAAPSAPPSANGEAVSATDDTVPTPVVPPPSTDETMRIPVVPPPPNGTAPGSAGNGPSSNGTAPVESEPPAR